MPQFLDLTKPDLTTMPEFPLSNSTFSGSACRHRSFLNIILSPYSKSLLFRQLLPILANISISESSKTGLWAPDAATLKSAIFQFLIPDQGNGDIPESLQLNAGCTS